MFEREEPLEAAKDWAAIADLDVAIWVDGVGQPAGRAPAAASDAVRTMAYETYVQEKPYGDTVVLDPPALGRLGEIRVPVLVIVGELDVSATAQAADLLDGGRPGRPPDRPPGRRPHAEPRAAGVVHRDAARVPRGGRRGLTLAGRSGPSRSRRPRSRRAGSRSGSRAAPRGVCERYCGYFARSAAIAGGVPRRAGVDDLRPALDADPAEAGPVLVPVVHQQRDRRPLDDVPDAGQVHRVRRALGLVVDRRSRA